MIYGTHYSPVQGQGPGFQFAQDQRGDKLGDHVEIQFEVAHKSLYSLVFRVPVGRLRNPRRDFFQIDGTRFQKADDETCQEIDPCAVHYYVLFQSGLDQFEVFNDATSLVKGLWLHHCYAHITVKIQ